MNVPSAAGVRPRRRPRRRLALLLRAGWVLAGTAVVVLGVWGAGGELEARARARAFCDWVKPGSPEAEFARMAEELGDKVLRLDRPELVTLAFAGTLPLSRHVCSVSLADGTVAGKTYRHVNALF